MNFGDIVGELIRGGLSPATNKRVESSIGQGGLGGLEGAGGLGDILGSVLGGTSGDAAASGSGGGLGDLLGGLGSMLGGSSGVGGMSRGEVGGIGALAGAVLGGGGGAIKGAVGGSAMALLGTLAISALKNWQEQASASSAAPAVSQDQIRQMTAPQTAELCLRGMIEAVKSDGEIAPEEIERIVGKLEEGGITADEQRFVTEHMRRPPDVHGLASAVPNQEVGVQVYAAALMAISVDTKAERTFLDNLARGVGLDHGTVGRLHAMVGAPAPV